MTSGVNTCEQRCVPERPHCPFRFDCIANWDFVKTRYSRHWMQGNLVRCLLWPPCAASWRMTVWRGWLWCTSTRKWRSMSARSSVASRRCHPSPGQRGRHLPLISMPQRHIHHNDGSSRTGCEAPPIVRHVNEWVVSRLLTVTLWQWT